MATISLFWRTNMAAMKSRAYALYLLWDFSSTGDKQLPIACIISCKIVPAQLQPLAMEISCLPAWANRFPTLDEHLQKTKQWNEIHIWGLLKKETECFHSRHHQLCKFIWTKEGVYVRKEFKSPEIGLGHQCGRCDVTWKRSIVLYHRHGCSDVTWKPTINLVPSFSLVTT